LSIKNDDEAEKGNGKLAQSVGGIGGLGQKISEEIEKLVNV
jgi:hypothetical protein